MIQESLKTAPGARSLNFILIKSSQEELEGNIRSLCQEFDEKLQINPLVVQDGTALEHLSEAQIIGSKVMIIIPEYFNEADDSDGQKDEITTGPNIRYMARGLRNVRKTDLILAVNKGLLIIVIQEGRMKTYPWAGYASLRKESLQVDLGERSIFLSDIVKKLSPGQTDLVRQGHAVHVNDPLPISQRIIELN